MDEENNSINNNKINIENNPLSEITKSNKIDGNQIKISVNVNICSIFINEFL